jgi:hypothetical protein
LWYGGEGTRGWDTERGRIVLRYGIPWFDGSFIGGYSRFNVLEYRDFKFVFEDVTRGGHFTLYSPKAGSSSSWKNDYVIQAAEMALTNPEQYDPKLSESVDLIVEKALYRGRSGKIDTYVQVFVPHGGDSATVKGSVGVFITDSTDETVDRSVVALESDGGGSNPGVALLELETPPGSLGIEVEFLSPDRLRGGQLLLREEVAAFDGDTVSMSDLLLASSVTDADSGSTTRPGTIVRSGYAIEPMLRQSLEPGADLLVYFEIYGLATNGEGRGTYAVKAALLQDESSTGLGRIWSSVFGRDAPEQVAVAIESSSEGPDEARFITVALPPEISGSYQFRLDVADLETGHRVVRQRPILIGAVSDH